MNRLALRFWVPQPDSARVMVGGFCSIRSLPSACRRRVASLMVQFPPFGGDEVAVRGGEAPASQTTSAKNADNGGVGEAACGVVNTTMHGLVRRSHANPLLRALTSYLARKPPIPRLGEAAHARISGPTCESEGPRAS